MTYSHFSNSTDHAVAFNDAADLLGAQGPANQESTHGFERQSCIGDRE